MARTQVLTTDAWRKQAWEEGAFRDTAKLSYFLPKLAGDTVTLIEKGEQLSSSPESIIDVKNLLEGRGKSNTYNGDKATFTLIPRLDPKTNAGVTSRQTL